MVVGVASVTGHTQGSHGVSLRAWYPRWPYIGALIVAVAVCGFALGKSPNPMEGAVKVFKSFVGLYPFGRSANPPHVQRQPWNPVR